MKSKLIIAGVMLLTLAGCNDDNPNPAAGVSNVTPPSTKYAPPPPPAPVESATTTTQPICFPMDGGNGFIYYACI